MPEAEPSDLAGFFAEAAGVAVPAWKRRMSAETGKEVYRQRAATSETVNADLRTYRGLTQITLRGLKKARCVALWCALAYNLMHFAPLLLT